MQSVDFVLEGKVHRAWPRSGLNQVAPNARMALHRECDARQFMDRLRLYTPDTLSALAQLCDLAPDDEDALASALARGDLVIGLGVQSGGGAMADAGAAERWRQKQAAPAPMFGTVMQQFFDSQSGDSQPGDGQHAAAKRDSVTATLSALVPSAAADKQAWECLVEVAGRNHFSSQSLALSTQVDRRFPVSADRSQPHRSLIAIPLKTGEPVALTLTISAQGALPVRLPLPGVVQPKQKGAAVAAALDNILIPVRPLLYRNLQSDAGRVQLPRNGFLYLFWRGKLWRELAVDDKGVPRDIDVTWEREQRGFSLSKSAKPLRKAVGHPLDAIWIPGKWNGVWQSAENGFELTFFRHQLSWDEIDRFEAQPAWRQQYTTPLDSVAQYESSKTFSQQDATLGPLQEALPVCATSAEDAAADIQNHEHNVLAPYRSHNFAAAYLQPTHKQIVIQVRDAYASKLIPRLPAEGETVTLSGNKDYAATVSEGRLVVEVDRQESRLILELHDNDHLHGTDSP